jgi:phosphoglucosamine mutase
MRATVIREKADLGIAFDGDADRVLMSDEDGRLLDGNAILAILASDMIERGDLPDNTVVTTIMANGGLQRALDPYGGKVLWTKVGDRYVVEAMREKGYTLGGESSGHIIALDLNTTGDALITALQVLATMVRRDQALSTLADVYQAFPEAHATVPLNGSAPSEDVLDAVRQEAEASLDKCGRVVIRPSGTEPIIRVMVQHEALRTAQKLTAELADKIAKL